MIGVSQQGAATAFSVAQQPAPRWDWAVTGAFFGGVICSGVLHWPLGGEWGWVALWFLADVVTGAVAGAISRLRWAYDVVAEASAPTWRLPYARPGSPGERLARLMRLLAQQWPHVGQPVLFATLGLAVALPLVEMLPDARLGAIWSAILGLIVVIGLLAGRSAAPLMVGLRAFVAWLLGYAFIGSLKPSLLVIAGLASAGLVAISLVEQRHPCLAGWIGRTAAWGLAAWSAAAQQPFLVAWIAVVALSWEIAVQLGRGPALHAWRLGWLTIMLLIAVAFRLGTAPT